MPMPTQHAFESPVVIKEMMFESGRRMQDNHPQQRPGKKTVHFDQHLCQRFILRDEVG